VEGAGVGPIVLRLDTCIKMMMSIYKIYERNLRKKLFRKNLIVS